MTSSKGTVLVADDDNDVRETTAYLLRSLGFRVLEASSGADAIALCARHQGRIDLLLTDLIMPGMTGRLLADSLTARRPGLAVVFMSGYVDDSRREALDQGFYYIQKPMSRHKLEELLKHVLEKKKSGA